MRRPAAVVGAALAAALLAVLAPPAPSAAAEVSADRLAELARAASRSPAALRELREVDRVDGRPANLRWALRGARGSGLRRRLESLRTPATRSPAPARARAGARGILAGRRFRTTEGPRPLGVPLDRLSTVVDRVVRWLEGLIPGGGEPRPGSPAPPPERQELYTGERLVLVLIALPAVALVLVILVRLARRRGPAAVRRKTGDGAVGGEAPPSPPEALEREAEAAEGAGELERALRLRFQAGLLRLEAARALELRPSLTSGEARRRLRSATFEGLSRTFDEVAYGGRHPVPPDVAAARRDWPLVVEEARPA